MAGMQESSETEEMFRRISQSSVERAFKGPLCYTEVAAEHVDPTLPLAAAHCANKRFNGIPAMPPQLPKQEGLNQPATIAD